MDTKKTATKKAATKKTAPGATENSVLENVEFFPNWTAYPSSYANARHEKGLTKRELLAGTIAGHIAAANPTLIPETIVQESVNIATMLLMECARVTLAEMAVTVEFEEEIKS